MSGSRLTMSSVPPVQRARTPRNLATAATLRPRDIFELYGIPSSTLHELCTHKDPAKRLPSTLLPSSRNGHGLRLVRREDFEAYLTKYRASTAA